MQILRIGSWDNIIIQFQQIIYVTNAWNKLILGHWRTDDLSSLEKLVQTVRLKDKQAVLRGNFYTDSVAFHECMD